MFERFTQDARTAVVDAQTVAWQAGSRAIDARHLLVALVEKGGPAAEALDSVGLDRAALAARLRAQIDEHRLDAAALASLGIDLEAVRRRADQVFGEGALDRTARRGPQGHIPFTPEAKKALELALREAIRLGTSSIHGGVMVLGVLRATGSAAEIELSRSLAAAGADAAALRSAVEHPEAQAS